MTVLHLLLGGAVASDESARRPNRAGEVWVMCTLAVTIGMLIKRGWSDAGVH